MSAMPKESWVALLEDDKLVEVLLERPDQDRIIGGSSWDVWTPCFLAFRRHLLI
ncbi:MAG: hypothetical protein CM1200mP14_16490 [Gammaproteobacteria bacterium]|nr:MAG: hypothetical protein CM1200mP14_16490 [Gammaproteobacteria bacterium]